MFHISSNSNIFIKMVNYCASEDERKQSVVAMTHEERLAHAKNNEQWGFGMTGSGIGCFAGICGGLWSSQGAGKEV